MVFKKLAKLFDRKKKQPKKPLLIGGARYRKGIKPFGTEVESVTERKYLGGGNEGRVSEVEVEINGKKITMAQKEFTNEYRLPLHLGGGKYKIGNPYEQFHKINELVELNRTKKLGLRITPTIRIIVDPKTKEGRLVMTKHDVLKWHGFLNWKEKDITTEQKKQEQEYGEDMQRQSDIAMENGWGISRPSFFPTIDKKTGKCVAIIGDFGEIWKIPKKELEAMSRGMRERKARES